MGKKKPKISKDPGSKKHVRATNQFANYDRMQPVWRVSSLDIGGPWCWKGISKEVVWTAIHQKIAEFEEMTWYDIKRNGSHSIPIYNLCPQAKQRLSEIQLDDIDEIFSLRLTGRQRIFGIKHNEVLKILWWDPDHQVCPSQKKHT
ncbi:hypothetical protein Dvar_00190 [Desulfosarcina variabilis str. Montpellier]|jgi:hypothetical protein|uniref:hypothetical protein n=1 Tax=Desulfosarcina variabilis TaxID=2300 RepID=UPI003AFABF33